MNRDEIFALAGKHISLDRHNSGLANQHELTSFANALLKSYKAELLKEVGEPVAARRKVAMWQGGDDYKYEWAVVKEHTPGTEPLYTSDQLASAILKATKPLEEENKLIMMNLTQCGEQLAKAEQRVAEACTLLCMDAVTKSKSSLFRSGAIIVAGDIRDGEWRKFVKEGE